ncbi:uncharacterized protein LAJ45_02522 [Morchella importuna]|uniref:uncharacterized protein n=1 Tax=Morchella importuna TaxID=1174673 RepID=UPI001E8D6639|nr:uncharacterized protein LAJ45_02522 [Morchella importuna]KAH8153709.1 hypothetical protein LAJ45_02522 [Morchella importuna]
MNAESSALHTQSSSSQAVQSLEDIATVRNSAEMRAEMRANVPPLQIQQSATQLSTLQNFTTFRNSAEMRAEMRAESNNPHPAAIQNAGFQNSNVFRNSAEICAEQPGKNSAFVKQVGTLEVHSGEPPVPVVDVLNALIAKQTAAGTASDLIPARALGLDDLSNLGIISNLIAYLDSQAPRQTNGRKMRVEITKADDKAELVKLCHEHFDVYATNGAKAKFFDLMRIKFWVATGGRLDVNVKGYMERWEDKRRQEIAEDMVKSGVARVYGEWEVAIDMWIAAVDDLKTARGLQRDNRSSEAAAAEEEKSKLEEVREDMAKTLAGEKREREESSEGNGGKRHLTEKMLEEFKRSDTEMMEYLARNDTRRLDRWESILSPVLSSFSTSSNANQNIARRLDLLEEENKSRDARLSENSKDLKEILELVKAMRNNS